MELIKETNMMPTAQPITVNSDDAWQRVAADKRQVATDCGKVVKTVKALMSDTGVSQRKAVEFLILQMQQDIKLDKGIVKVALKLGRNGKLPSYSTINRWVNNHKKGGLLGLVPKQSGSSRKTYGWEVRAMHLYALPSKPSISAVARKLTSEGFEGVTDSLIRRFIKNMPADKSEMSRGRLGPRLFDNTQKTYKHRTMENLPVGSCYQGDGHTLDVYLQHPNGNKVWRAELTLWLDVTSRYVVGWYLSEAESAHSTLFALSYAILKHDHIPAILHIDNGSGYKNKMLSDDSTGFYAQLGIDIMHARPYNAKAKGQVERFFGTMERDFNKWYDSYCGADMADEALQLKLKKYKKGETTLPTREQWIADFNNWLDQYHDKPHKGLEGKTPAQLWATLERHSVDMKSTAIFWPRTERTVKRQAITLDKREYMAPELIQYNNKKLTVEYNLHDDSAVRVLDNKGRWLCDAKLVSKHDYLPASRLEEAKQKRLASQIKRLEVHTQEKRDRAGLSITHDQIVDDMALLNQQTEPLSLQQKTGTEAPVLSANGDQAESKINIDIFDTDY